MSTKLVVSVDGLLISNLTQLVTSRSIDEVIVVNSSSSFNGTNFLNNQASRVLSVKTPLLVVM